MNLKIRRDSYYHRDICFGFLSWAMRTKSQEKNLDILSTIHITERNKNNNNLYDSITK